MAIYVNISDSPELVGGLRFDPHVPVEVPTDNKDLIGLIATVPNLSLLEEGHKHVPPAQVTPQVHLTTETKTGKPEDVAVVPAVTPAATEEIKPNDDDDDDDDKKADGDGKETLPEEMTFEKLDDLHWTKAVAFIKQIVEDKDLLNKVAAEGKHSLAEAAKERLAELDAANN